MPNENRTSPAAIALYFEQLAREHVDINHSDKEAHFCRREFDEINNSIAAVLHFPAIVFESNQFVIKDLKSDNTFKIREQAFMVINAVSDITDYEFLQLSFEELEEIGDDFIARIKADRRKPQNPIRNLDFNSVEGTRFQIAGTNIVYVRYILELEQPFNADVNPLKWKSNSD